MVFAFNRCFFFLLNHFAFLGEMADACPPFQDDDRDFCLEANDFGLNLSEEEVYDRMWPVRSSNFEKHRYRDEQARPVGPSGGCCGAIPVSGTLHMQSRESWENF